MRSHAEELAAVRERLDRTAADQDPRWVLGEQALADAGELAAAYDLGGDLDAAYMLGMFYWFRFEASGSQAGQDDGTVAALFLIPVFTSDPGRLPEPLRRLYQQPGGPGGNTDPGAAADRARAQFSAYQDSGQLPLLRESVTLFGEAVTATPAGHPDRAGYLSGLGGAMLKLAERTGDAGLLEQAASTQRAAAVAAPSGHPDRAAILANLGTTLEKLAVRTGDAGPLREAVQTCQEAADAAPASEPSARAVPHQPRQRPAGAGRADWGTSAPWNGRWRPSGRRSPARPPVILTWPGGWPTSARRWRRWSGWTGDAGALREAAGSIRGAVAATETGQPSPG